MRLISAGSGVQISASLPRHYNAPCFQGAFLFTCHISRLFYLLIIYKLCVEERLNFLITNQAYNDIDIPIRQFYKEVLWQVFMKFT